MDIEQLKARIQALLQQRGTIMALANGREDHEFTADESKQYEDLTQQINAAKISLQRAMEHAADVQNYAPPTRDPIATNPDDQPGSVRGGMTLKDQGFNSVGEFLRTVYMAGIPNGQIDQRLRRIQETEIKAATGANEAVPSDGGYLVGIDISNDFLDKVHAAAQLAGLCRAMPISSDSNTMRINGIDESSRVTGSRWGGVQAFWIGEAGTVNPTRPKFRQIELTLKKLMALGYATDEQLTDAAQLQMLFDSAFPEEMAYTLDDAILSGTGAGMPLGILNSAATVSVAKETGQAAKTIVFENIQNMWSRMWGRSRASGIWFINQDVEPQLNALSLAVGVGGSPVYLPPGGLSDTPYARLLGRPVIPIEQTKTLGTVGDIVLADFSQYLLATKGGIQSATSIHVQFIYDEQVFRWILRVDGQPGWNVPMTPATGSLNTLSPWVTLATRA